MKTIVTRKARQHISKQKKLEIVAASHEPGILLAEVARRYDIGASSLIKWRKQVKEGSLMGLTSNEGVISAVEFKKLNKRIKELEQILGRKTAENEILKEAVSLAREKNLSSDNHC